MTITSLAGRCTAVVLVGATAVSLAACGSSATSSTSSSTSTSPTTSSTSGSSTPAAAPHGGKDRVSGLVSTVNGGTITVTGRDGTATVDVTPTTRVTQLTPAQLTDVTAGECGAVHPTKDGGQPPTVTAAAMMIGTANDARCGGNGHGEKGKAVVGNVASITGSTVVVTAADGQDTVTITPQTRYEKRAAADASAITAGVCLAAHGSKDANGALQATAASVRPARDGKCG